MTEDGARRVLPLNVPEATAEALVRGCAVHNGVRLRRGLRALSVAEYLLGCIVEGQEKKLREDHAWVAAQRGPAAPAGDLPSESGTR